MTGKSGRLVAIEIDIFCDVQNLFNIVDVFTSKSGRDIEFPRVLEIPELQQESNFMCGRSQVTQRSLNIFRHGEVGWPLFFVENRGRVKFSLFSWREKDQAGH